jgi:tetratricopeptide (TPR) repeat protein
VSGVLDSCRKDNLGDEDERALLEIQCIAEELCEHQIFDTAGELYANCLEIRKTIPGWKDHPDTLRTMLGLSNVFYKQERWDEAEKLTSEVLCMARKALGDENSDTLDAMNDLSEMLCSQERGEEAEKLVTEVVYMRRKTLGNEHSDTLDAMSELSKLLCA